MQGGEDMSFGEGNLHERVKELEIENGELRADILVLTADSHIDFSHFSMHDLTVDEMREFCQDMYEAHIKLDSRCNVLERANGELCAEVNKLTTERELHRNRGLA